MIYAFDDYELDTQLFELRHAGQPQQLEPQVFDVLSFLVQHSDRVVTKQELLDAVWPEGFVTDATLSSRITAARKAVRDTGREQRLIRTLHGRGFRFVGQVRGGESRDEQSQLSGPPAGEHHLNRSQTPARSQTIRFCTTADGVRLAYAVVGEGPPIVKAPNWLTHLEYEWQSPVWRHWWEELAKDHQLIRFDQRGSGLSDRNVDDLSFDAWVLDLETVVAAAGVEQFALLGISQGGAAAIEYAARHSNRVSKLILCGAYARGWAKRGQPLAEHQAVLTLMREGWGRDNPVYRQLFSLTFMPEATPEQIDWFNELQRVSTSGENAARLRTATGQIDVLDRLQLISAPTLVIHARGDERIPFNEGRQLAALIPNARLVTLESRNHLTLDDEPAWPKLLAEVRAFLAED